MELCHSNSLMDSPAVRRLAEFVAKHCEQRASENEATSFASLPLVARNYQIYRDAPM